MGLRFVQVCKRYGALFALRGLTLEISPGEFILVFGPNGSGKTTLLRLSALLSRPSSGTLEIASAGLEACSDARKVIGFVGHQPMLYEELTGKENLRFFARLYGVYSESLVDAWLREVDLWPRRNDPVRNYSRGMRQRLSLARALVHQPRLVILDEPTTGLDQAGAQGLVRLLADRKASGSTVIASTHDENVLSDLATRKLWLDAGTLVADSASPGITRKEL
jgi:heme ABC exporter ATP-binding subunit CcmA